MLAFKFAEPNSNWQLNENTGRTVNDVAFFQPATVAAVGDFEILRLPRPEFEISISVTI